MGFSAGEELGGGRVVGEEEVEEEEGEDGEDGAGDVEPLPLVGQAGGDGMEGIKGDEPGVNQAGARLMLEYMAITTSLSFVAHVVCMLSCWMV